MCARSFTQRRKGCSQAFQAIVLLLCVTILFTGCHKKKPRLPSIPPPVTGTTEVGLASWYGHPYHGRRAANGEVYDMNQFTAAHRTLPFGTWVRVHNLTNGRNVDVRITDRGPFVEGRIIDLSRAAARQIGLIGPGTAKVRLEVIAAPAAVSVRSGDFVVQVGAFVDITNARRLRNLMEQRFGPARLVQRDGDPPVWRVLVGRGTTKAEATKLAERIRSEYGPAFVVRLDAESN